MTANPVLNALVNARLQEQSTRDTEVQRQVYSELGLPPKPVTIPEVFARWCNNHQLVAMPARPASVAMFVLQHTWLKEQGQLIDIINEIGSVHSSRGLADPTRTWPVPTALARLDKVEPPRSWTKAERAEFDGWPRDAQTIISRREKERDRGLAQAQQRYADTRRELEEFKNRVRSTDEPSTKTEETASAKTETAHH